MLVSLGVAGVNGQDSTSARVPATREEITLSFAPVVRKAAPAVVNIYTKKLVERQVSPFAGDPFFERFFGDFFSNGATRKRTESSLGSGVIVDPSGIVVSNNHVVGGADEITVILQDRREYDGKVIFADKESDLAVVQLDGASNLPVLELRDSDTLEVGDLVLAIGNPFGIGQTVTSGIVSGLARSGAGQGLGRGYFIQTDAAINPGNSGGALVDMKGRLVGVNTAILTRSGGSNGIGFAVPANLVARVIDAVGRGAMELDRPWLGISGQPVTGELAAAMNLDLPRGILLEQLHPQSAFHQAGLLPGDVLLEVGGDPVNTISELEFRVATLGTGRTAPIRYLRRQKMFDGLVRLAAAPDTPPRAPKEIRGPGQLAGLDVVTVNPSVIEEAGLSLIAHGAMVMETKGASRRSGLRPGDVIFAIADEPVKSSGALAKRLRQASLPVVLQVMRHGRRGTVTIRQ